MLLNVVNTVNTYLSDDILVILPVAVEVWFSVQSCFVQVRCFARSMRKVFGNLSAAGYAIAALPSCFWARAHPVNWRGACPVCSAS